MVRFIVNEDSEEKQAMEKIAGNIEQIKNLIQECNNIALEKGFEFNISDALSDVINAQDYDWQSSSRHWG